MSMEVDDRDQNDEQQRQQQQVLDQLREILEECEKKLNLKMQVSIGLKILGCLVLTGLVLFVLLQLGGAR